MILLSLSWIFLLLMVVAVVVDSQQLPHENFRNRHQLRQHRQQQPTPYPAQFVIDFVTNLTASDDGDGRSCGGSHVVRLDSQQQRIDHGAGAYECTHFYATSAPCTLLFNSRGMYRVIIEKDRVPCCLDLPQIGPPPPDWAVNGTLDGVVYDRVSRNFAYQWTFDHLRGLFLRDYSGAAATPFHTVQELAFGKYQGRPLTFTFPGKAEGRQDYHFRPETMIVGTMDPSIFSLAEGCSEISCRSHDHGDDEAIAR